MSFSIVPFVAASASLALLAASTFEHTPRLIWNASRSLPLGIYAIHSVGSLEIGNLVAVQLPSEIANWAEERGYLAADALLLKEVSALPRARICRSNRQLSIDNVDVANAAQTDSHGRLLPAWKGCFRLTDSEVFLLLRNSPDSLDGRYFGATATTNIVGRARPIWTWEG